MESKEQNKLTKKTETDIDTEIPPERREGGRIGQKDELIKK